MRRTKQPKMKQFGFERRGCQGSLFEGTKQTLRKERENKDRAKKKNKSVFSKRVDEEKGKTKMECWKGRRKKRRRRTKRKERFLTKGFWGKKKNNTPKLQENVQENSQKQKQEGLGQVGPFGPPHPKPSKAQTKTQKQLKITKPNQKGRVRWCAVALRATAPQSKPSKTQPPKNKTDSDEKRTYINNICQIHNTRTT